ncbi:hypothetical protein EDB19DRAFT_1903058 [Suillus lakei]|nr:hypothetical protein EDB19DRAFT_1903058 [Suillus lakei]
MPSPPSRILLSSPIGSSVAVSFTSPVTASPSKPSTSLFSIQIPLDFSLILPLPTSYSLPKLVDELDLSIHIHPISSLLTYEL